MTTTRTKEFIYKSTLRDVYGLTPSMIDELDPPDKIVDNPHYTNAPSASLYLIVRVESWIDANQERVEKARASRAKRSEAAKKFHDKLRAQKRDLALEWVGSVQITLEPLPDDLIERANARYPLRAVVDVETEKGLRAFVRHRLSNYESLLALLRGYEPWLSEELYPKLRSRVDGVVDQAVMQWYGRSVENRWSQIAIPAACVFWQVNASSVSREDGPSLPETAGEAGLHSGRLFSGNRLAE